jgi:methionyl aminopeptidase
MDFRAAYGGATRAVKIKPFLFVRTARYVTIKTDEVKKCVAGPAAVLEMIGEHVKPGITTEALDTFALILSACSPGHPCTTQPRGYKSICTSVNRVNRHPQ